MYINRKQGDTYNVMELKLCCKCCRIFFLNFNDYFCTVKDGVMLYRHVNCPPIKAERPPLKGRYEI